MVVCDRQPEATILAVKGGFPMGFGDHTARRADIRLVCQGVSTLVFHHLNNNLKFYSWKIKLSSY
jgi:hypothetical protein